MNIVSESAFTATPNFVTATLPPASTLPATQMSILPASTLSVVGAPTIPSIEGTTTTQVNVRAQTSTASETLGLIEQFAKVQITGKDASGSWYQIIYADSGTGHGWIRAEYVQVNAPAEIPFIENTAGSGSEVSGLVIQKINVRNGPATTYDSLGILNPKDLVIITGKDASGAWMQIEFANAPEGYGWVALEFLQVTNVDLLPIIGNESTATPIAIMLPAIQDGDSMQAPLAKAFFSAAGARALQVSGEVSAPNGDAEDWVQFTSTSKAITIHLTCSSGALNIELWNNMIIENNFLLICGDKQIITIAPNNNYFLRLSEVSANEFHYTHYSLSLEAIRYP